MKIQFVGKRYPDGQILHEAQGEQVPRKGDFVTIPGYRDTVVDRVLWVFDEEPAAVVVLG